MWKENSEFCFAYFSSQLYCLWAAQNVCSHSYQSRKEWFSLSVCFQILSLQQWWGDISVFQCILLNTWYWWNAIYWHSITQQPAILSLCLLALVCLASFINNEINAVIRLESYSLYQLCRWWDGSTRHLWPSLRNWDLALASTWWKVRVIFHSCHLNSTCHHVRCMPSLRHN